MWPSAFIHLCLDEIYDKLIHTCSIFGCGSCAIPAVIKTSLITSDHHVFMIRAESALEVLLHLCFIMLLHPLQLSQSLVRIFRSMCSPFCCQIVAYVSIFFTRL